MLTLLFDGASDHQGVVEGTGKKKKENMRFVNI